MSWEQNGNRECPKPEHPEPQNLGYPRSLSQSLVPPCLRSSSFLGPPLFPVLLRWVRALLFQATRLCKHRDPGRAAGNSLPPAFMAEEKRNPCWPGTAGTLESAPFGFGRYLAGWGARGVLGARVQSCVFGGCRADARVFPGSRSLPVPVCCFISVLPYGSLAVLSRRFWGRGLFGGRSLTKCYLLSAKVCGGRDEERETATTHLRLSPGLQPRALAPKGGLVELKNLGAGCGIRQEPGV